MAALVGDSAWIKHPTWSEAEVPNFWNACEQYQCQGLPTKLHECGSLGALSPSYQPFVSSDTKTNLASIVLNIMPDSENKARSLRGELYHAFTPELVAERRRCARACTKYNKAGEDDTMTRRRQVELWKE